MVTFNPYAVVNFTDSFSVQSQGYVQGDAMADPSARYSISAGVVDSGETLPMWGGIAVFEKTAPATSANTGAAPFIGRATASANLAGFSTFAGTISAPTTPQSPVPIQAAGGSFNFVRIGSGIRIVVKCSSAVIALAGSNNPLQFSWDATNQQLIPYDSGAAISFNATLINVNATNSANVSYDSGTGFATWNNSGATAVILI